MARRAIPVFALALALAGCGGGGGGGSNDEISLAAAKTSKAGSIKADFTVTGAGVEGGGTGIFNTGEKASGQLTMTVHTGGQTAKVDSVITPTAFYMRSPSFSQLTGGKEWLKLDLARLARQRGINLGSLLNTSPTPTSALAYLNGSSKVEKVGSEQVQGVGTTHYHATVDLERAAARAKGNARESLQRVIQASGVKKVPVDVWIDDKGYVRKVVYETGGGGAQSARVTMVLHDFGSRVPIKIPPKASVVDLMQRLQGGQ